MPGVFGENVSEPSTIKFVKGKIAVSAPVRLTGFNVSIDPAGAEESGAFATPAQATVKNGTEVIFTAHEPFGWKFVGWLKNDQLISREKNTTIEVYDPFTSLIQFVAKYEFDPVLRNGRYLELGHGWYFDFKFDGWAHDYAGRVIMYMNYAPGRFHGDDKPIIGGTPSRPEEVPPSRLEWTPSADYHFVVTEMVQLENGSTRMNLIANPAVVQDTQIGMTLVLMPTAIGFNLAVEAVTLENPFGLAIAQQLALKWVGDHSARKGS
jgi:hypothetical protein